jgi:formamidopyrimidine-DNA glycosylase
VPELPEVEVVRRGLDRWVAGRRITHVEVLHPRAIRRHAAGAQDFSARLAGQQVLAASRRGKYLWLPLDGGGALLGHLGMSGQLLVQPEAAADEIHLRVRMRFEENGLDRLELRFVDQRTFGGLSLEPMVDGVPVPITHIARDPMDPEFDDEAFIRTLRAKQTGVKRALLDQSLISGVGNIYADESLWRARLHYERPTAALSRPKAVDLLAAVREVLGESLDQGGTSFDSLYVNVNGESGYFSRSLNAYGRADEPCGRCGTPIRRAAFMNRSSYYCPRCQRR